MSDSKVVEIGSKRRRRDGRRQPGTGTGKLHAFVVRIPEALYQQLEAAASANYRSVAQEVHMRLARGEAGHADG